MRVGGSAFAVNCEGLKYRDFRAFILLLVAENALDAFDGVHDDMNQPTYVLCKAVANHNVGIRRTAYEYQL